MDPLSISMATIAITNACLAVSRELKAFIDGAKLVGPIISVLLQDVEGFQNTLEDMQKIIEDPRMKGSVESSGHVGNHWANLKTCLVDAKGTMENLEAVIVRINKPSTVLDSTRKHLRFKNASDMIGLYQQQIRSYKDTISVSLQTAMLWNQVLTREISEGFTLTLDEIQATIRRLGHEVNSRIASMSQLVTSTIAESESSGKTSDKASDETSDEILKEQKTTLTTMQNLRSCLQSAASVASSASTVMGRKIGTESYTDYGSDFGDIFPEVVNNRMLDWIDSNRIDETGESDSWRQYSIDQSGETSTLADQSQEWDSDDELELEMSTALIQYGNSKLSEKNFEEAESYFENCIDRVTQRDHALPMNNELVTTKLNAMSGLITALKEQSKWDDAQKLLRERIEFLSRCGNTNHGDAMLDTLMLAEVLLAKRNFTEALLYGKKAYRAFKKMGTARQPQCRQSLNILIDICRESGKLPDAHAWSAILHSMPPEVNVETAGSADNVPRRASEPPKYEYLESSGQVIDPAKNSSNSQRRSSNFEIRSSHPERHGSNSEKRNITPRFRAKSIFKKHPETVVRAIETRRKEDTHEAPLLQREQSPLDTGEAASFQHIPAQKPLLREQTVGSESSSRVISWWPKRKSDSQQTLRGHSKCVRAVAFSPDGKQLASASDDKTIWLWEAASGATQQILRGHSDNVRAVAFSPDGKQLASASKDKTVRLWDTTTGILLKTLQGHSHCVRHVTFSPDGKQLASASEDKTVRLWDAAAGTLLHTLQGHSGHVGAVAFSPNGEQLASASYDKTIRLWDATTGAARGLLRGHSHPVRAVAFSPNGEHLASASYDTTIRLWNASTGALLQTLRGHTHWVRAVAFSPDGQHLASASADITVRLWDVVTGETLHALHGHSDVIETVAFSPDGKQLVSASDDKTIRFWDAATGAAWPQTTV